MNSVTLVLRTCMYMYVLVCIHVFPDVFGGCWGLGTLPEWCVCLSLVETDGVCDIKYDISTVNVELRSGSVLSNLSYTINGYTIPDSRTPAHVTTLAHTCTHLHTPADTRTGIQPAPLKS